MRLQTALPPVPRTLSTCATLAALIGGLAFGQDQAEKLAIGSPAPPIDVEHWFHGHEPINAFEEGKVYLVEFWATGCGPCISSMPHLASIQQRYPDDLVVISVSHEDPGKIEEFLDRKTGDQTYREITSPYRLATDPDRSVSDDYMRASGQGGIPTAFLVGKTGEIEWIGHPVRMDHPVEKVVAGQWDRAAHLRELEEERMVRARGRHVGKLMREKRFAEALVEFDAASVHAKSGPLREWLQQARRGIEERAALHEARSAEQEERAVREGIRQVMRLLDDGKRYEAVKKMTELAEEADTPEAKEMLKEARRRVNQMINPAAGKK